MFRPYRRPAVKRLLWFRRDLRVEDNPLLSLEGEVLPIFIFTWMTAHPPAGTRALSYSTRRPPGWRWHTSKHTKGV